MKLELSETIDRPPAAVFRFVATDHVKNHPRWDPNMRLTALTEGPMGVGTVIRRRYLHGDRLVEGEMEIVEYEPDRSFAMIIRDGLAEVRTRMRFEPEGEESTRLIGVLEVPADVERMDPDPIQASLRRMKELIEAEPG